MLASQRLRARIFADTRPIDELLVSPQVDRISYNDAQRLDYRRVELPERFGPLWATYWFRVRATVPEEWRDERVELLWYSGSEGTLWRNGRIVVGLNKHHAEATLADSAEPGEVRCEIELACNGLFGQRQDPVELTRCAIARFDPRAWTLFHDFETLRALEARPAVDPVLGGGLRGRLERAADLLERGEDDDAQALLHQLFDFFNQKTAYEIAAIGHAHIDTAWLWPLAETY